MRTSLARLLAIFLTLSFTAPALAQKSKSALMTEIAGNFPDNAAGSITPQTMRTVTTDMVNSWQQYASVNLQAGTTYTVGLSDYGQLITFSNVGSIAVSLPQAAGSFATFNFTAASAATAGVVTFTPTGGSTINGSATFALVAGTSAWIVSDGTNWQVAKGSGSGTVVAGTTGQLGYYPSSSASISGAPNTSISGGALTLGTAGSAVGSLGLANATSGSIVVQPVTGALGSSVLTLPAATDTFGLLAATQAFTNKTYNGLTLTATTGTFTLTNAKTLAV